MTTIDLMAQLGRPTIPNKIPWALGRSLGRTARTDDAEPGRPTRADDVGRRAAPLTTGWRRGNPSRQEPDGSGDQEKKKNDFGWWISGGKRVG
jgi:hypothetical protein